MNFWFTNTQIAPQLSGGSMLWGSSEASPT
jgi:hypothetical protein